MRELVKRIKTSKASGIDRILSYLIKDCFRATVNQLVYLINLSFTHNRIPAAWKWAVVTPIHKAGSPRIPDNYRPISTLPVTAKLLEQCPHRQILDYLVKTKKLTDCQFGFRPGYSTNKAISTLLEKVYI